MSTKFSRHENFVTKSQILIQQTETCQKSGIDRSKSTQKYIQSLVNLEGKSPKFQRAL